MGSRVRTRACVMAAPRPRVYPVSSRLEMAAPPYALGPRLAGVRDARLSGCDGLFSVAFTADGGILEVRPQLQAADARDCPHHHSAAGGLLLPALLDGHLHPDKTLLGLAPEAVNALLAADGLPAVTVQDRIAREVQARAGAAAALGVEARARNMLAARLAVDETVLLLTLSLHHY